MIYINSVQKLITGRNVIIAIGLYYGFYLLFFLPISPVASMVLKNIPLEHVPDLQENGYSLEQAREFLNNLGMSGRSDYLRNLWTLDLIFPMLSAISTTMLMLYCFRYINVIKLFRFGVCIPLIVMICDYCENILLTMSTIRYPDIVSEIIMAASMCTQIKWIGINLGFIVKVILLALFIGKTVMMKFKKNLEQ